LRYSQLQLRFRLWGEHLDPAELSRAIGVAPTKVNEVGRSGLIEGGPRHKKASWQWWSAVGGWDIRPLLAELLATLGPGEAEIRSCVDRGAEAALSVVGHANGDYVQTVDDAVSRGYADDGVILPMLDSDRIELVLDSDVIRFLASISAWITTHIDVDIDSDGPSDVLSPIWTPFRRQIPEA